jgi:hypothetical protein
MRFNRWSPSLHKLRLNNVYTKCSEYNGSLYLHRFTMAWNRASPVQCLSRVLYSLLSDRSCDRLSNIVQHRKRRLCLSDDLILKRRCMYCVSLKLRNVHFSKCLHIVRHIIHRPIRPLCMPSKYLSSHSQQHVHDNSDCPFRVLQQWPKCVCSVCYPQLRYLHE